MSRTRIGLAAGAVVAIWCVAWMAVMTVGAHGPRAESVVATAAAFDFVVTAGVAMWLIASRRPPRWLVGSTLAIGVLFARIALGRVGEGAGALVLGAGVALELALVVAMVASVRKARRAFRRARAAGEGGFIALTEALEATRAPARVARVIATELYVFAMVAVGWRKPRPAWAAHRGARSPHDVFAASAGHRGSRSPHDVIAARPSCDGTGASAHSMPFTVHRVNGWSMFAGVIVFLTVVETTAVHVALTAYASRVAAWIVTALSIYSALWLIGDALALRHGGVFVRDDEVELRIGVRWNVRVPRAAIVAVEASAPIDRATAKASGVLDASILGANTLLRLAEPVRVRGMFGRSRTVSAIALSIDDRDAFTAALDRR